MTRWTIFFRTVVFGLIGIAALVVLLEPPAGIPRALLAVNPIILLLLLAGVGATTAQKAGLKSVVILKDQINWQKVARTAAIAIALGMIVALIDHILRNTWRPDDVWDPKTLLEAATLNTLGLGITYGAVTEEILMRWGLMSGLMLWMMKYTTRTNAAIIALSFAGLIFAAGHLPALIAADIALTPAMLIRVALINAGLGAWFGWLYFRNNLETAMIGHAGFHLGAFLIATIWL